MSKLTALIAAAKAATPGSWIAEDADDLCRVFAVREICRMVSDGSRLRDATFIALANPATILELCTLLEKAEEALEEATALCTNYEAVEEPNGYQFTEAPAVIKQGNEALNAIKQWKEQA